MSDLLKTDNRMGPITKEEILSFGRAVLDLEGYSTCKISMSKGGSHCITGKGDGEPHVYIGDSFVGEYRWEAMELILHEIAHIDTWPEDQTHGRVFFKEYVRILQKYMVGFPKNNYVRCGACGSFVGKAWVARHRATNCQSPPGRDK